MCFGTPLEYGLFSGERTCLSLEELVVSSRGSDQLEAKVPGLFSDSGFDTDAVRRLIFHPDGFFVGAPGRQHEINDPGYFVRGGGDGFRSPEFRAHPAKVMPQVALAPVEPSGGDAEGRGCSILDLACFDDFDTLIWLTNDHLIWPTSQ
jgi:hypothetical protein